jgi:hypothetical protein
MRPSIFVNIKAQDSLLFWRFFGQTLCTLVLGFLVLSSAIGPGPALALEATPAKTSHHVYCLRGFMSIFSLGMDDLCDKLSKLGINATVHSHVVWSPLAAEAAENYKSGRVKTIILVGHSLGATAVADITDWLGQAGVPVRLAIELDPVSPNIASGEVDQFINYYISTGVGKTVSRGPHFKGTLRNIDIKDYPDIGHLNIDKLPIVHEKLISQIRQAINVDRGPTPVKPAAVPKVSQAPARAVSAARPARQ